MATVTKTATVMTCVRNGYSTTPTGYAVGGPGTQPSYNNSIYMTFPNLGIPQGSIIHSATLNYTMTGWDWQAAINIDVQACSYAGTPSSQAPVTGSANTTYVPAGTYVHSYSATNAVIQMVSSGAYYLKMFAPNGSNRKIFSSTKATLTVDYTSEPSLNPPSSVTAPGTITSDSHNFVWGSGSDNNGIYSSSQLSYDMQIYSGSAWSSSFSTGADVKQYILNLLIHFGKLSGQYYYNSDIKIHVRSKVSHNGTLFYSGWKESATGTIDWRIVPSVPSALTLSHVERYEGEAMTFTVGRPGSYNNYDNNGDTNNLKYTVELDNGADLVFGDAPVTAGSKVLNYTVGQLTSNKSDLNAKIRAFCEDTENQVSFTTSTQNLEIKRFREPVIVVADIDREETSATVNISIVDTGFGGTQSSNQIGSVEYKIGGGAWTGTTLGTWVGLNNSFEITGLNGNARYNLSVRCTNIAAGTLPAKTSMVYSTSLLEFTPAFFIFNDGVTETKGIACKSLIVGDDYSQEIDEGEIKVNGNAVWHAGNDGSGSGLDADTVDGVQASDLKPRTAVILTGDSTSGAFWRTQTGGTYWNSDGSLSNAPTTWGFAVLERIGSDFYVLYHAQATGSLWFTSGNASTTTCIWKEVFNQTAAIDYSGYGSSSVDLINMGNHNIIGVKRLQISEEGDLEGIQFTAGGNHCYLNRDDTDVGLYWHTPNGWLEMGPLSTSFCHFYTDRPQYYFNKDILVDGNLAPYSDGSRLLGIEGKAWGEFYLDPPTTTSYSSIRRSETTDRFYSYSSSLRYKENIRDLLDEGIDPDVVYNLKVRIFDEKPDERKDEDLGNVIGLVAEEVAEEIPDIIYYNKNGDIQSYSEDSITMLTLGALQQLKDRVEILEKWAEIPVKEIPKKLRMKSGVGHSAKRKRIPKIGGMQDELQTENS